MKGLFGEIATRNKLQDKFLVPPFSVLDTTQGYWQARKRQWLDLGIESELGRGDGLRYHINHCHDNINSRQEADKRSNLNNVPPKPEWATKTGTTNIAPGTAIFDPVLCELIYKWFCKKGGLILDPFAGGSVRGVVASYLGYGYIGVDLSSKQLEANRQQAAIIVPDKMPYWIEGDACGLNNLVDEKVDLIFSCPPYFNLEVYSEDPLDLSNAGSYLEFITKYRDIIKQTYERLKLNRFACFVVANIRDTQGYYYTLVEDTIRAFLDAGYKLYNEAILVNSCGSLPIRITRQFENGRKLGKRHQNVLIFIKGEWRQAIQWLNSNNNGRY